MRKRYIVFFFLCMFIVSLTGCKSEKTDISKSEDDSYVKIYFTNETGDRLLSEKRKNPECEDKQSAVDEMLDWMLEDPEEEEHIVAVPNEVVINNAVARNNVANIDFAVGYETIDKARDVICRAAIVKTLVQIDGIDYVEFSIGGKTMMDSDNTPIGSLTEDSFVFDELPMKEEK